MTDQRKQGMQLADYIHELTEPHSHAEHYELSPRDLDGHVLRRRGPASRNHVTKAPALIAQLWDNDVPSQGTEDGPRPGFASKPAARLDALVTARDIDLQAHAWIRDLGEQPRSLGTVDTVRQLHGLVASADDVTRKAVERDTRRWWTRARIVTGWDSPAWTPDNTCPRCEERGTLKIRLASKMAMCTFAGEAVKGREPCRAVWDEESTPSIFLLADHIRAESEAEREPRAGRGPCWCPYPKPIVPDLSRLCAGCGSARCRHALGARLLDTIRAGEAS